MIHPTRPEDWQKAADWLMAADGLMITAGAGMGVDSGLPDFRGNEGFWQAYPPMKQLGLSFVEMANPQGFVRNPPLAWGFYGHRLNLYRSTLPHPGYHILKQWGETKPLGYFVFTSNVDGHFQKAGFAAERIEECHGTIHQMQCTGPCSEHVWHADPIHVEVDETRFLATDPLPHCIHCHRLARPNILMFGDEAWVAGPSHEQSQRCQSWLALFQNEKTKLVIIELGAGQAVATVRTFSESLARMPRASLIRINPRDSGINAKNHLALPTGALEGLHRIADLLTLKGG